MFSYFSKALLFFSSLFFSFSAISQEFSDSRLLITLENAANIELCGNYATFNVTVRNISNQPVDANSTISVLLPDNVFYVSETVSAGFNDLQTTNTNQPVFTNEQILAPEAEIILSYQVKALCDENLSQWDVQTVSNSLTFNYSSDNENYTYNIDNSNMANPDYTISEFSFQVTPTDYLCDGYEKGSVTVTTNTITAEYTLFCYTESETLVGTYTGSGASYTFNHLPAGNYNIIAQNACGCIIKKPFTINGPEPILISFTTQDETSHGASNGSITAAVQGGTPGYTYYWIPGGQTTPAISNLTTGHYDLSVTDANGCVSSNTASITDGSPLNATITTTNKRCYGDVGLESIQITINNGVGPYSFIFSDGVTRQWLGGYSSFFCWYQFYNFTAGNYSVIITDAVGNSTTIDFVISEPTNPLTLVEVSRIEPVCSGSLGSVVLLANGGTPGYTYSWVSYESGSFGNTRISTFPNITGLNVGNHTITVTDANGCQANLTIAMSSTSIPQASVVVNRPTCYGESNGKATVTLTNWNQNMGIYTVVFDGTLGSGNTYSNTLSAGNHIYQIYTSNGCNASGTFTIPESHPVIESVTPIFESCDPYTWNVEVTATTTPGFGTYHLQCVYGNYNRFSPSTNTNTMNVVLDAGFNGTVMLVENFPGNGSCSTSQPFSLPDLFNINLSIIPACSPTSHGSINLTTTGGTAPYQYEWSNQTYNQNLSALPGVYQFTVTDANGCKYFNNMTHVITSFNPSATSTIACYGQLNGSASVSVTVGSGNYSYLWSNGATTSSINNVGAGIYTVTVTDIQYLCNKVLTVEVLSSNPQIQNTISLDCSSNCTASCVLTVTGSLGSNFTWQTPTEMLYNVHNTITATNLCPGSASIYQVTDNYGCIANSAVIIPNVLSTTMSMTRINCNNSFGSATVGVTNGQPPYTYLWSTGSTSNNATHLTPGTYYVTVTDSYNCSKINSVIIPAYVALNLVTSKINNCRSNPGEATVSVSGGRSPYLYLWKKSGVIVGTTPTITNLAIGTYTVTVTDADFCTSSATVSIIRPTIDLVISTTHPYPASHQVTTATCTVNNGLAAYSYKWYNLANPTTPISSTLNTNATSNTITGLTSGAYSVVVTDRNFCKATQKLCNKNFSYSVSCSIVNSFDCQYTANATGGRLPYTYLWSNGATTQAVIGSSQVTVTDADGCVANPPSISSVCICQGISPRKAEVISEYNVYPNPASDIITIEVDNSAEGNLTLEIFDVLGKKVLNSSINTMAEREIGVSQISNGLYFYRILLNGNVVKENKLLISR